MKRAALIIFLTLLPPIASAAEGMPGGRWWRRPEIIQRLEITEAQQTRLDAVFRTSASELIDLRAEVEKRSIGLRSELDRSDLNRAELQKSAERLSQARARLFEREIMLLADMRTVLNDEQWSRFRVTLERGENRGRQNPSRPRQRRPRP